MKSTQIKKKVIEKVYYYANCKFCEDKYLESLHLSQLVYNLKAHEDRCSENSESITREEDK